MAACRAEELTAGNDGLILSVAISYGGRSDIARAAAEIAQLVHDGALHPSQVRKCHPFALHFCALALLPASLQVEHHACLCEACDREWAPDSGLLVINLATWNSMACLLHAP